MTAKEYAKTYFGSELLKKHNPSKKSIWLIYGESPNCDYPHPEPFLGAFEGALSDAISLAVSHPKFCTWGGGGRIEEIKWLNKNQYVCEPQRSGGER